MSRVLNYVGIDVGAKSLVVALKNSTSNTVETLHFDNNKTGHKKLLKRITKHKHYAQVCLEATGIYHFQLALSLSKFDRIGVMVVNPKAMHHFSTSMLQRAKTDHADSHMILEYLIRMDFVQWQPPTDEAISLQRFSRRAAQLKKMMSQEQARLAASEYQGNDAKEIRKSISATIKTFQKQINALEQQCSQLIQSSAIMTEQMSLLLSFKGIAKVSAIQLMSELMAMPKQLTAQQWVACAGLDPRVVESGTSIHKPRRISKRGNKYIRSALYMPALVAIRHDNNIRAYYQMLLEKGKKKMQAIVAVMRKLLMCIWGALHNNQKWNGDKFYKIENLA